MSFLTIEVRYIHEGKNARVEVLPFVDPFAGPTDIVVWQLHNIPVHAFAEVNFDSKEGFRGPFQSLTSGPRNLFGLGRVSGAGSPASYSYEVSVQTWDEQKGSVVLAKSDPVDLTDHRSESIVTGQVTVDQGPHGDLIVHPAVVATCAGAPMNWDFRPAFSKIAEKLKPGEVLRPRVLFQPGPGGGNALGPYASMTTFEHWISAFERQDQRKKARYHYDVQIEATGQILRVAEDLDPIIDDEGDPPASGGEILPPQ